MSGKSNRKDSLMFRRIRVQLTVGITGLILLLSGLLSLYFYNTSLSTLTRLDASMLERVGASLRTLHDLSRNTGQSLFLNNEVVAFSSSNSDHVLDITRLVNRTQDYGVINPFLRSVYVYNGRQELLVNIPEGSYAAVGEFFDQAIVHMIRQYPKTPIPRLYPVPRKITVNSSGNPVNIHVLTYCIYSATSDGKQIDSALFLNIDADVLRSLVSASGTEAGALSGGAGMGYAATQPADSQVLVVDEDGLVLSHPDKSTFAADWSDQQWLQRILADKNPSGSFMERVDGKKTILTWLTVSPQNWRLISMTPAGSAFAAIARLMIVVLVVCGLILMAGILYAILASRRIYRPIGNLVRMVQADSAGGGQETESEGGGAAWGDEMATIANAYRKLTRRTVSARNREKAAEAGWRVRGHLDGSAYQTTERLREALGVLHSDLDPQRSVLPVVLRINRLERFQRENPGPDRAAVLFGACNILAESMPPDIRCLSIDMESDHVVLLLQGAGLPVTEEADLAASAGACLSESMSAVGQHLGFTFSIAIGRPSEWSSLPEAWQEAQMLSQYRLRYGANRVLTTDLLPEGEQAPFALPAAAERSLLDAVRLFDAPKAMRCFTDWKNCVADAPMETIMTSSIHLVYAIFALLGESTGNMGGRVTGLMIDMLERTSRFETMEEIEEAFHGLIGDAVGLLEDAKTKRPDRIVGKVDVIIDNEFADRNLCLNVIADRIALSSLYLGRMYKGLTGKSVAESIMKRRLEQVKRLLDTTGLPIQDILERSGLERSNYFYTVFRKHFGVSLGEYRRKE